MASKSWTEEEMKAAIDEVQSGKMTQYRAAKLYKIPRQTLNDRLTNKVKSGNVGRPIRLSVAEEKEIVEACIIFSEWGYGIGKKEVISIVADYCKSKKKPSIFPNGVPGRRWWSGFLKRNPQIAMRKPQSLQIARAKAGSPDVIDHWFFSILKPLLEKTGLEDHPERIFNADETSFCLCGRPQKIIARKGAKAPQYVVGGTGKENITVQGCISGDGKLLPPYILYTGQRLMFDNTQGGPVGTRYGVSERGWMTEINFLDWMKNLFIPSLPDERPVLLIIDGHKSHIQYEVLKLAVENNIEIAKLPAHSTHLLQPLDVSVFKPLKEAYDKEAHNLFLSQRRYITKRDFPTLLSKTWKTFKPTTAINGFKKTGIIPFSRDVIPVTSLAPSHPFTTDTTVDDVDNVDNVDNVDDVDDVVSSLIDVLGNDLSDITEENIISYLPNSICPTSPIPTTIIPPTISTPPTSIGHTTPSTCQIISTPSTLTTHQTIISTPPTSIGHTTPSTHQIISTPPTSINCPTNSTPPTSISPTTPTSLTHPTITTQPSTSKATSSLTSSPGLRDFFLEFLKSKSPINRASRSRRVASFGESLTANEALQRQKEYIDEKKRKEDEKVEKRRLRLEKQEEKKRARS